LIEERPDAATIFAESTRIRGGLIAMTLALQILQTVGVIHRSMRDRLACTSEMDAQRRVAILATLGAGPECFTLLPLDVNWAEGEYETEFLADLRLPESFIRVARRLVAFSGDDGLNDFKASAFPANE
jgi:hypothetical protein